MKRLLNTLYLTLDGAWVSHEGESLVVRVDHEIKLRYPIHGLAGIICIGNITCSASFLALCAEKRIAVSYLNLFGRFQARVTGPSTGSVLLRKRQYRLSECPKGRLEIAKSIIIGKIANQRTVVMRFLRDHPEKASDDAPKRAIARMLSLIDEARNAVLTDELRGTEGEAAKLYFEAFDQAITAQKADFYMRGRSRRPPLDNVNAMLSFLYTLLVHDAESALEAHGLDRQVGFLHADRPGRPSLALDMVEEFRPVIVDRVVLSLVNLRQVDSKGFKKTESGGVIMDDETRKTVIVAFQKRKQEEVFHTFIDEKVQVGLLLHVQTQLLARHLRGDIDGYPPFFWK